VNKLLSLNQKKLPSRIQSPGLSLVFDAEEIEAARKRGDLLSLDIELTKRCNLRCLYCYAAPGEKQKDELSFEELKNTIDEARGLGLRTLTLTGGEPLLDEKYFDIATYAHECGLSVLLFTNGILITKEVAKKLLELRVSPCVKLDALSSATQDKLVGVKGALEKIKTGINNLISVGYTTGYPALSVNATVCRENIGEIPKVWDWARQHHIVPSLTRLQLMGRAQGRTDLMVSAEDLFHLYKKLSEIDKGFGIDWEPTLPWVYGKACRRHYIGCFIDSQGYVQPCSGVPIKAGNVRKQGFREILRTAEIFKIARNLESHIEGACKTCQYRDQCYGCRSIAYFMNKSFTAADPLCWHY